MRFTVKMASALVSLLMFAGGLVFVTAATASADSYMPRPGARMNNPIGSRADRNKIKRHILRSIYSAPRHTRIRVMSWNIRSHEIATALVRAHRRGVTVQVLMDRINSRAHPLDPNNPIPADNTNNADWWWMKREFRVSGNSTRPAGYHSWARLCTRSCRGRYGLPHIKMITFQRVTHERYVVMYTSGNLTDAASSIQWNDMYTTVGRGAMWSFAQRRFAELARDQPMANAWRVANFGPIRFGFFPWHGAGATGDPVRRTLRYVHCTGALSGSGNSTGHTVIRVAQTAINDARGRNIATTIKSLWDHGCDIRILYGLMGPRVKSILRARSGRGPVPMRQLAQDRDGDFVYDRYLHQKSMTISGHWGSNRRANYTWNGSANWAGYTLASDEIYTRIRGLGLVNQYNRFINYWFTHIPRSARGALPDSYARVVGIDPYAKFDLN